MPRELTNKQKRRTWEIRNAQQELDDVRKTVNLGDDYRYYTNRINELKSRIRRLRRSFNHDDIPRHFAYPDEMSNERIVNEIARIHEVTWDNYAEFCRARAAGDSERKQACADEHVRMGDRRYALEREIASRFSPSESAI